MQSEDSSRFFKAIGVSKDKKKVQFLAKELQIDLKRLQYYNKHNILPTEEDLIKIQKVLGKSKTEIMLVMGIYDTDLKLSIAANVKEISKALKQKKQKASQKIKPVFKTELGQLYSGDCIQVMQNLEAESVDLIFADPPFNLNKLYPSGMNDNLADFEYIAWCEKWLEQCVRVLKFGGSLFVWNIPEWNIFLGEYLNHRLKFRDLIAADIKFSLPIQGKLYPSHYSLLYYIKGEKPNSFHPDRLPMEVCKKCFGDLKDYGGYKDKMNPLGINLTDVWYDVPPVRHSKYKKRKDSNELSIKLLDRIVEMSSKPGDVVLDPFGGSGTTYVVSELKKRKWIGIELDSCNIIKNRFNDLKEEKGFLEKYRENYNLLFPPKVADKRKKLGLWTTDTYNKK